LPAERLGALGATPTFHHELLAATKHVECGQPSAATRGCIAPTRGKREGPCALVKMRQLWIFRAIASSVAAAYLASRIVAVPSH